MDQGVVRESTTRLHYESVKRAITAMRCGIDQPLSLRSLARIGFASPYHFTRTFRSVTGLPPLHFLSALRLDVARTLLLHTRRKVIDICYDVGYSSVGTFTRRFTGCFGVSPQQFRALAQSARHAIHDHHSTEQPYAGSPDGTSLSGRVMMPEGFRGIVCVGLFATAIPQSKPLACTVATPNGEYRMQDVPQGNLFLFALGLELPIQPQDYFCHDSALRAGGQSVFVSGESIMGDTNLFLRPPLSTDAPILLFLAELMHRIGRERQSGDAEVSPSGFSGVFPGQDGAYVESTRRVLKQF
ncbi:MAG TPA: AraC family transcriptional regulator [Candidatus Angelobacter sp.]